MRILPAVTPTAEQLPILLYNQPGVLVIRGAAGSGKTTTALLRLKQLCMTWAKRRTRLGLTGPVRVLVLTYNRTLEGYIQKLANEQIETENDIELRVSTFGKWAVDLLGPGSTPDGDADQILERLASAFNLDTRFVRDEVEYVLGRLQPTELETYLTIEREGRGISPRMDGQTRRRLLDEVIYPYLAEKDIARVRDWNDVALEAADATAEPWDVVIVDEAQDFSANQVRAVLRQVATDHTVTFVMDAAQRIYPRSFTWSEVGITPTSRRLTQNYRNTKQIAAFAHALIDGMVVGDDGTLPDFAATTNAGQPPTVLVGKFSDQLSWTITNVLARADLGSESVVFLHPLGGGWFSYVKARLDEAGVPWVQLTRASTWPGGEETVALCTIHSAKGLEFDHVVILGLNQQVTPHGAEAGDARFESLRRLLAMGVGRARKSVTIGFKPGEESTLTSLFGAGTYTEVRV